MPMFIDPRQRVPVTVGPNTVFIRSKMDLGTRAAVQDEIRASGIKVEQEMEMRGIGSYRLALLRHNVLAWEGPDFLDPNGHPIPCSRQNIALMDPNEPLVEAVAEEIGRRNQPAESPDPNAVAPTGSTIDGELRLKAG